MKTKEGVDVFYKTTCPDRYGLIKGFARSNRNAPTDAEHVLWQYLRKEQLGVKFRRQHAVLDFIADFICLDQRLIIEVDGEYHFTEQQTEEDMGRTRRLENMGYTIIRFTNSEVQNSIDSVLEIIKQNINT